MPFAKHAAVSEMTIALVATGDAGDAELMTAASIMSVLESGL